MAGVRSVQGPGHGTDMGLINIDDLHDGMVLSEDLLGPHGRFLLPEGTVLDAGHLRTLKIWGVTEAPVRGVSRAQAEARAEARLDPALLARARDLAEDMFRAADCSVEPMAEARRLAVISLTHRLAEGWVPPEPDPAPESRGTDLKAPATAALLAREEAELSTFPDIYHRIMEVLRSPASSARHVARVVGMDASLSARLLRLVNSPFYGFPSRIETMDRAVAIVGMNEVTTLAMGLSLVRRFKDLPASCLDMKAFWKHCISCGILARLLAGYKVGLPEERHFVAGLLHDLGRLAMLKRLPGFCAEAMRRSQERGIPLYEAERALLGYDHAQVARELFTLWRLPEPLVQAVGRHHAPAQDGGAQRSGARDAAFVQLADILALCSGMGASGSMLVPPMRDETWRGLDLPLGALAASVAQARRQVGDIVNAFLGEDP